MVEYNQEQNAKNYNVIVTEMAHKRKNNFIYKFLKSGVSSDINKKILFNCY